MTGQVTTEFSPYQKPSENKLRRFIVGQTQSSNNIPNRYIGYGPLLLDKPLDALVGLRMR